ncbi:MAG: D-2-hydroxyacid dehydrogenase [Eubacteriales bacterium]|nr:D-2-hydroxyacid dehydrogenase [Eubacteriales bacterium]
MIAVNSNDRFLTLDQANAGFAHYLKDEDWQVYQGLEAILADRPEEVEILFNSAKLDPDELRQLPNLRWIFSYSAGVNNYPLDTIREMKVQLTNTSGVHGPSISEQVLGAMIMFSRNLLTARANQEKKIFDQSITGDELWGKRLLIVGAGSIGQVLARRAKAFDMDVVGIRRHHGGEVPEHFDAVYTLDDLGEQLALSDYVVSILPSTPDTQGLFGLEQFQVMRPSAVFINVGRGDTVKEAELIVALEQGLIRGAYLDVFELEPLPEESPLWQMENVLITPHNAGPTPHYFERAMGIFLDNLERFRQGKPMRNLVDLAAGY